LAHETRKVVLLDITEDELPVHHARHAVVETAGGGPASIKRTEKKGVIG